MGTSPRPYQQDRIKYGNADDTFKKPRQSVKSNIDKRQHMNERIKQWTTFYRRNYHRFAEHYLELRLHFFQKVMLYFMGSSSTFMAIASRGISKSFTIGIFACCEAILKPNSIIVIVASSKQQAGLIVKEKIESELMPNSPNLRREIKKIESSQNNISVRFHNGSRIIVVVSGDGARGNRAQVICYEEFRLIPRVVVEEIIKPFLISRTCGYHMNPKYTSFIEEPKQIYISSAYYKAYNEGYMWQEIVTNAKSMIKGFENNNFDYVVMGFDYLLSMFHGLKTKKTMDDVRAKTDEVSFLMEYGNIMFSENESSYFKLDLFRKNQTIKKCFYPYRAEVHAGRKKKYQCNIPRQNGEIRIVTCDFASSAGKKNDNSILGCIRLLPTNKGYTREVVYMESHNGENTIKQALRVKQLYYDFESDYIVMDIANIGASIYDMLGNVTKDDERDIEYEAMTIMTSIRKYSDMSEQKIVELQQKTMAKNALPIIYPISGTLELNSSIAVDFKDKLQLGMVNLLVEPDKAEDYLLEKNDDYKRAFESLDSLEKATLMNPYNQTSEFVNETVNLEYTVMGGKIRIEEKKGRKDRYSSISYGSYFATRLEVDILKEEDENDMSAWDKVLGF